MSDQVRIYSGDTVKVVSLDKNKGLTMGEGTASMSVEMMAAGLAAMIGAAVTCADDAVTAGEGTEQ